MQVVANDALLLPQPTRHAGMKMAPEEVEALLALPEVDHSGLVRVQAQPEVPSRADALTWAASAWLRVVPSTTKSSA